MRCAARPTGQCFASLSFAVLSLYGPQIPYNTCRNAEWQICAARGTLPGQATSQVLRSATGTEYDVRGTIRFAKAPSTLEPHAGPHPIGSCGGYAPLGCSAGYASSDIFYLESCFYSMMCANRDELFSVQPGRNWTCQLDRRGFERMRDYVLAANAVPPARG